MFHERPSTVHQATREKSGATPPDDGDKPRIVDAAVDQHEQYWIRYGNSVRSIWFSLPELLQDEKAVFARLSGPGMTFLTTKSKNIFKAEIQAHREYRRALVANGPGWLGEHFVTGDGMVIRGANKATEVIVTFEPRAKFAPRGSLEGWQARLGPVVRRQPSPLAILAFAFVPPLLRFAPAGQLNPAVELVGGPETGKSTLAAVAASVWAGDPTSEVGGGETWDVTLNALDRWKLAHKDSFLVLDEGNLTGVNIKAQSEMVLAAVFKLAKRGGKARFTDTEASANAHIAVLSTSNRPLSELIGGRSETGAALASRMATIRVPPAAAGGVLVEVPEEFATRREAIRSLRAAVDENYGVAGRAFVERLVLAAANPEAFSKRVQKLMTKFQGKLAEVGLDGSYARVEQAFALIYAAGVLARRWGILPKEWGPIGKALLAVYRDLLRQNPARHGPKPPARSRHK